MMRSSFTILTALILGAPLVAEAKPGYCYDFEGASIIAKDGKFLGVLGSKYDTDSIFNKYSAYGSRYSASSIWNKYGQYGGAYSSMSPFNKYSNDGPRLVKNKRVIGKLTINKYATGAANPNTLSINCFAFKPEVN
jgi:hypothetical protein